MRVELDEQKAKKILGRYPVAACYIFGSYTKGDLSPLSDIDFGILLKEGLGKREYSDYHIKLAADLEEAAGRGRADVVILNKAGIPLSLKYRVIRDGKIIYETDEIARARFEYQVMREYFDRKYYLDRHVELSLKAFAKTGLK